MRQQGRCVLPADETGRVLDRLTALEQVITPTDIQQALEETGRVNPRACKLTHEVMMWIVLAMGIFTDLPIRQVFKHARRLRAMKTLPAAPPSAWHGNGWGWSPCVACSSRRFTPWPTPDTPGAFYRGLRLVAVDGTVLDVPDTAEERQPFWTIHVGSRGDGAFPQVRKLSLVEVGTHVEFALTTAPYGTGEKNDVSRAVAAFAAGNAAVVRSRLFQL